ncbi:hypothetical protein ABZ636_03770 [Streptomyces sp. NPDC007251]|uniref:hypothetical protein n=1 Tax=Streptomyces sp. NPDC007251 TaxID=3154483 RepID=UPI00340C0D0E
MTQPTPDELRERAETDMLELLAEPPRNPCPSRAHHAHPGLDCQQYTQWRWEIQAAIGTPQ